MRINKLNLQRAVVLVIVCVVAYQATPRMIENWESIKLQQAAREREDSAPLPLGMVLNERVWMLIEFGSSEPVERRLTAPQCMDRLRAYKARRMYLQATCEPMPGYY